MAKQRTVSFYTQGCRLNQSETAVLESSFKQQGFQVTESTDFSDIVVVNTCTVTENGDKDARRLVSRISRQQPQVSIALIGCLAQIQKETLLKWPNVKWVVGTQDKMNLPSLIKSETTGVTVSKITPHTFSHSVSSIDKKHTRANLKIQDGCDFYCAFCIIPFARGPARSRSFSDIVQDAKQLADYGHQEVVITGVNLGTYSDQSKSFMSVVDALEKIDGLSRIRISSIEPTTIPDALISKMGDDHSKVCSYLHIPLQSGCNEVLQGMKRKYSLEEFDAFIKQAKSQSETLCIGTDVIVGFPGETDDLFDKTADYLRQAPIDFFHVFSYSERTMARSKRMSGQVDRKKIAIRSKVLRTLSQRKLCVLQGKMIGKTVSVLFEQQKQGQWVGLTDNYCRVKVFSEQPLNNQLVEVKLLDSDNGYLLGKVVK